MSDDVINLDDERKKRATQLSASEQAFFLEIYKIATALASVMVRAKKMHIIVADTIEGFDFTFELKINPPEGENEGA